MSYVKRAKLNHTDDLHEALIHAGLSVDDCIELCDISRRTWYRWRQVHWIALVGLTGKFVAVDCTAINCHIGIGGSHNI